MTIINIFLTIQITVPLEAQAEVISAWWEYTGKPHPGVPAIIASLKRLVSDVMCHPMTIGKVISTYGPKRKKGYPKSIHLVGTGNIEVQEEIFFNNLILFEKAYNLV